MNLQPPRLMFQQTKKKKNLKKPNFQTKHKTPHYLTQNHNTNSRNTKNENVLSSGTKEEPDWKCHSKVAGTRQHIESLIFPSLNFWNAGVLIITYSNSWKLFYKESSLGSFGVLNRTTGPFFAVSIHCMLLIGTDISFYIRLRRYETFSMKEAMDGVKVGLQHVILTHLVESLRLDSSVHPAPFSFRKPVPCLPRPEVGEVAVCRLCDTYSKTPLLRYRNDPAQTKVGLGCKVLN